MIRKGEILERARAWALPPEVVEKDYVLGWLLAGLARNEEVQSDWVFKGGTCLKKCYFETYRFSEDLDFTLRPTASYTAGGLLDVLTAIALETHQLSGLELPPASIKIVDRQNKQGQATYQARVPYRGPLGRPQLANILFDITQHEVLAGEADARAIFHPYPDDLPDDAVVATYSIEELFAEKTRALFERTRPRDLYDIIQIVENHSDSIDFTLAREIFHRKCTHKHLIPPRAADLSDLVRGSEELKADWQQMLAHQLPVLPPIQSILERLDLALSWLDTSDVDQQRPEPIAMAGATGLKRLAAAAGYTLIAPPSISYWGSSPIEQIRFAGANRLLVSFTYNGKPRLAEPYSLRRSAAGQVNLFAWVHSDTHIKQFRISEIQNLQITEDAFAPRYAIELTGSIIPSSRHGSKTRRASGPSYVFRCPVCDREFKHEGNNASLRPHQDGHGSNCAGRRGFLERVDY
jgi:predicted nucleotidyltransferase component of viral defense system